MGIPRGGLPHFPPPPDRPRKPDNKNPYTGPGIVLPHLISNSVFHTPGKGSLVHAMSKDPSPNSSQHILVTGAHGGIGTAVVGLLEARGFTVTPWDLPEHDVTDTRAVETAVRELDARTPVSGLVHTAGILHPDSALNPDVNALHRSLEVNLMGVVAVCSAVARRMTARGTGSIVAVTSNAGSVPRSGMAAYGASKAAATSWLRTLGLECAPHGVRCNIVTPGSTDTPMLRGMWPEGEDRGADVIAGTPEKFRLGIPLKRLAQPTDVAEACLYLLSPASRHITMHDLRIDGGATLDA